MSPPADRTESVFAGAVALPAEHRAGYLDRECANDPVLRKHVDALLRAHERSSHLLDKPVPGGPEQTAAYVASEKPGTFVAGRYKLLESIGEGGMGTVWVAEQTEPVKRKVAIKLIKAGMDSKSVLARFEAERQALALMDHPNIAKVLDGGMTEQGRPYFVMEYVKGVPITEYCDATRLSIHERMQLFILVCQAVQHAHQKGIIHRDLKPSNILVAPYDDKPVPKIIDFGLAKAMHQSLTERTLHTAHESVLGTPLYMSPEQAQLNNLDVDTRSDIYSLGVLLYELLTGTTPLEKQRFKQAAWDEVRRIIREEEPPRPSTRLSSIDTLPSLAAGRHTDPLKLTRLVKGELDWIVMKALEKDRTRRYETANGFAADVLRYLSGEAVLAHPPTWWYRYQKFSRRHRGAILATYLFLVGIVIFTGSLYSQVERAQAAERLAVVARQAEVERAEGERLAKLDAQEKEKLATAAAEKERQAREQESAQRVRAERAYARTADVLDAMVSEVTGDSLATQKEITAEQKKFLAEVLTYYQEFAGEKADDVKTRLRTAQAALRVGLIESRLGRKEESAAAFRRARDGFAVLTAKFPAVPDYRRDLAASHNGLGIRLVDLGKRPEAEEQYRKALAIQEKLAAEFPAVPEHCRFLASIHNNLGLLLARLGKQPEAEEQYRKALAIREKLAAEVPTVPDHRRDVAISRHNLGLLLAGLGKQTEADEQYRKALAILERLAAEFPTVLEHRRFLASSHNNLGLLLAGQGKRLEAEEQYHKALVIAEKLAAEFPSVPVHRQDLASTHNNLGNLQAALRKRPEAEEQYHKSLAILEKLAAEFTAVPDHRRSLASSHYNLGNLLAALGKRLEAEEQYRKALAIREKLAAEFPAVPDCRRDLAGSHNNLGILLAERGKRPEAEEHFRQALALQEELTTEFPAVSEHRRDLARSHTSLGLLLADLGKRPEAEEQYRKALAIREKLAAEVPPAIFFPAYAVELGSSYCNLGNLVRDDGRVSDSLECFNTAIRTLAPIHEREPGDVTARQFLLNSHVGRAMTHDRLQQYAEAILDWDKAIELSPQTEQLSLRAARATSRLQAGQVKEAVAEVAELTKSTNWNAGHWYDYACVYAVTSGKIADKKDEYAKRAVELLQRAVKAGYKDLAHMNKDTRLDPLRNRDDFKKLLAELEKKP